MTAESASYRSEMVWVRLRRITASRLVRIGVIATGLVAIALNSVKHDAAGGTALSIILFGCLAFFLTDWVAESAIPRPGETSYWRSGAWIIDALSVIPVPAALLLGVDGPTAWLFGSLWLFKLASFVPGLSQLGRVVMIEARALASVVVLFLTILFFSAVLLHLLEREAQPAAFDTVPKALWWAVTTLTTTGYGDAVPITAPGRLVAGLVMICGLGVFGLLTGILATGFVEENRRSAFVQNWNLVRNVPFFRALEPAGLIELARMLRRWDVSEGTTVVRRGREGDCMYFVASGEVEVDIEPPVRLGPGSFFGELALLGSGVRNASVSAIVPSTMLVLEAADFRTFMAHHPELSREIEAEAARRAGEIVRADAAPAAKAPAV